MRVLALFFVLMACGSGKDTVVEKAPAPEAKPPLTKCDEAHALADSKIVECGFADPGVRVMVCSALGWAEAYNTCKAPPPRSTSAILGPGSTPPDDNDGDDDTDDEDEEDSGDGPIVPPPAPKPTTPTQQD
jgi:hypothetical protein